MEKQMTAEEKALYDEIHSQGGVVRKLLGSDEIRLANSMVKRGLISKGTSDDKQKSVCFSPM